MPPERPLDLSPQFTAAVEALDALDRRVLLLAASNGVFLDISLAALPFEEEVLQRASA